MARKMISDWKDENITLVVEGSVGVGYIECVSATEFKAFRADGSFVDWFDSKREAADAL